MGNLLSGYIGGLYIRREDSDWDLTRNRTSAESPNVNDTKLGGGDQPPPTRTRSEMDLENSQKQHKRIGDSVEANDASKCQRLDSNCSQPGTNGGGDGQQKTSKASASSIDAVSQDRPQDKRQEIDKLISSRHCSWESGDAELGVNTAGEPSSGTEHVTRDTDSGSVHQVSQIDCLPVHILLQIFSSLSVYDLLHNVCLVSKDWYDLTRDPDLWRTVNLKHQTKLDDEVLQRVISYSESVHSIDISDARSVSDDGIEALAKQCTGLQKLKLARCLQLKEPAFMALGHHCPNITSLHLNCCFSVTDKAMQTIAAGCPRIRRLYLNQCSHVSNDGIKAVGEGCHNLEELCIDQCKQVGDRGLLAIIKGCHKMTRLSAMSCVFTSQAILNLTKLPHLRHLELHDVLGVTDDCIIEVIKYCKDIEMLNLALCTQITDRCIDYVARHSSKLRSLYAASCDLTNQALVSLGAHSRTIETVDVGWCNNITDEGAVCISETCSTLRNLTLIRCDKVTVQTMDYLVEKFPHIHYSTFWLDCQRFMNQAQKMGYAPAAQNIGGNAAPPLPLS